MITRNEQNYLTCIKFSMINLKQEKISSPAYHQRFQELAPTIAWNLSLNIKIPVKYISIKLYNNFSGCIGAAFTVELAGSKKPDNKYIDSNESNNLVERIKKSIAEVDPNNDLDSNNTKIFQISTDIQEYAGDIYTSKVDRRTYTYNVLDYTDTMQVYFISEAEQKYQEHSHSRNMKYDAFSNITSIQYEYKTFHPPASDYIELLIINADYIIKQKNSKWISFIDALKNRDFDLALRRACAVGSKQLVSLLLEYNSNNALNLDINSISASADLTSMDYAIKSNNQELITLLAHQGAKQFNELRMKLVDTDRSEIQKMNPRRKKPDELHATHSRFHNNSTMWDAPEPTARMNGWSLTELSTGEAKRINVFDEINENNREIIDSMINFGNSSNAIWSPSFATGRHNTVHGSRPFSIFQPAELPGSYQESYNRNEHFGNKNRWSK